MSLRKRVLRWLGGSSMPLILTNGVGQVLIYKGVAAPEPEAVQ